MTTASNAPQKCSKVPTGSLEWATGEQPEQLYVDRLTIMITKVLGLAFLLGLLMPAYGKQAFPNPPFWVGAKIVQLLGEPFSYPFG